LTTRDTRLPTVVIKSFRREDKKLFFELDGIDGGPNMAFECEERRGRPELVSLTFTAKKRGRGLRTADLVRINVDDLIRRAYESAGGPRIGKLAYDAAVKPGRPRTITPELLAEVERVYTDNQDHAPVSAVMGRFDVAQRQAYTYIRLAREQARQEGREF
jgi:hypothetical protein